MGSRGILLWLYLVNAAVLITHEIDSAFWHEWELFGMPGGIQLFLCLNLIVVIAVLYGLQALALGLPAGLILSWVLVAVGILAFTVHGYFLLQGNQAFRNTASLGILAATAALSLAQGAALLRMRSRI